VKDLVNFQRAILQVIFSIVEGVVIAVVNHLVGRSVHNLPVHFNNAGSAAAGFPPGRIKDIMTFCDPPSMQHKFCIVVFVYNRNEVFV